MSSKDPFSEILNSSIDISENKIQAFSELICDILVDADIMDVPVITDFNVKVGNYKYILNFYELEADRPELILGSVLFSTEKDKDGLLKNDIDNYIGFLKNFVTNSITSALYKKINNEGTIYNEVADLSKSIYQNSDTISKVKLILATNLNYLGKEFVSEKFLNKDIIFEIWDNKRFNRFLLSGTSNPPIEIDFNDYNNPIPCLKAQQINGIYDSYLTFIDGTTLEKLYDKYGTRLLERNVRAFLQTKGKINKGIQDTIREKPEYFLAYNNGLTITCDNVELTTDKSNTVCISSISDFQIVNGGQTTASLWHAKRKFKNVNLDKISVIAKINELKDKNKIDQLASDISLYSNKQNKVNPTDPKGNKSYYRTLEKLSRVISTPESARLNPGTKWFYDRVRGAFIEEKNRKSSVAEMNNFLKEFPSPQRIEKTQAAKLENTWMLQPYYVSKGAQWNFLKHTEYVEIENISPDEDYFKRLIAKQILWKRTECIISDQNIPGYRANIVTYTLAIIAFITGNKIDLLKIWNTQEVSGSFEECINKVAYQVRDIITGYTGNVTEYCKKESCWEKVRETIRELPNEIDEIVQTGINIASSEINPAENKDVQFVLNIPGETWKNLSSWGKHTGLLQNWEKSICMGIGNRMAKNCSPTIKQAYWGKQIYERAQDKGYKPE
jgi:hypothetical protein